MTSALQGIVARIKWAIKNGDHASAFSLIAQAASFDYPEALCRSLFHTLSQSTKPIRLNDQIDFCCKEALLSGGRKNRSFERAQTHEKSSWRNYIDLKAGHETYDRNLPFLESDWLRVAEQKGLFDPTFYAHTNPDIDPDKVDIREHFFVNSHAERTRDPSNTFSVRKYYETYPDVCAAGMNALAHFILHGQDRASFKSHFFTEYFVDNKETIDIRLHTSPKNQDLPDLAQGNTALYLHIHYPEALIEIVEDIKRLPDWLRIVITTTNSKARDDILDILKTALLLHRLDHCVVYTQNRGRDLGAFIHIFKKLQKYDLVCKLHLKRSPHLGYFGLRWSRYLVESTIGTESLVKSIISFFQLHPQVGIFAPTPFQGTNNTEWADNRNLSNQILRDLVGANADILITEPLRYPSATIFWFRPESLFNSSLLALTPDFFPEEPIGIDGTAAHALERILQLIAKNNGYETLFYNDPFVQLKITKEWEVYNFIEESKDSEPVIIVGHEASNTGAPRTALALQKSLIHDHKLDTLVVLLKGGPLEDLYSENGKTIIFSDNFDPAILNCVFRYCHRKCKVITNTVVTSWLGKNARDYGHTHISLVHENANSGFWSEEMFINSLTANLCVFPGEGVMKQAISFCNFKGPFNYLLRPQGIYREHFPEVEEKEAIASVRHELGLPKDTKIVMGCGMLEERKGVDLFFKVASIINGIKPDHLKVAFLWVGSLDSNNKSSAYLWGRSFLRELSNYNASNYFIVGDCIKADRYFQASNAFFLSSRQDPFPGVVLEAMACKKPIVAFQGSTDVHNAFINEIGGILSPISDLDTAANHLLGYLTNERLAQSAGHHNKQRITDYYNFKSYASELLVNCEKSITPQLCSSKDKVFSIIIPCYKTPLGYLQQLFESIKKQTYSNWEICISLCTADCDILAHVKGQATFDTRIKLKETSDYLNISENTNQALSEANGDYYVFVDHDDTLPAYCLEELLNCHEVHNADLVYSAEDKLDESGLYFHSPVYKHDFSPNLLLRNNYITHICSYKSTLARKTGLMRSKYNGAQDYDFLLRASRVASKIIYLPRVLYHWRVSPHSTSDGTTASKEYAVEAGREAIVDHLKNCGIGNPVVVNGEVPFTYNVIN